MGKIYKGAVGFKISAVVGEDMETLQSDCQIRAISPSGTVKSFDAEIDAAAGTIYYATTSETDLDESGLWTFYGLYNFTSGAQLTGQAFKVHIYEPGSGA